ncbi:MAG: aspartate carbamoyltransferase catalytic subunit [Planctomycetota bacterium]|jgi:aspartate carbamoyltransferase catalytic subunit
MATCLAWNRHDLLALDRLSRDDLLDLLERAERFAPIAARTAPPVDLLPGRLVALLFFEDSTRTRCSFAVAAHRLGAHTIELGESGSSRSKGETIVDTTLNIEAMGVDAMVIRSRFSGAPDLVAQRVRCPVINAGDGRHEHPTQGLLDIYTLRQRLGGDLAGRRVGIVGDIGNSRVARSNIHGLTTLGAEVILCGPPTLVQESLVGLTPAAGEGGRGAVRVSHDLDAILPEVDAIMMLRVQFERGSQIATDYREHFGLTARRADALRPGVPVMHPGPTNRGLEIDSAVMDDPQRSLIMAQVTNGVAVRMAVLEALLASPEQQPRPEAETGP